MAAAARLAHDDDGEEEEEEKGQPYTPAQVFGITGRERGNLAGIKRTARATSLKFLPSPPCRPSSA